MRAQFTVPVHAFGFAETCEAKKFHRRYEQFNVMAFASFLAEQLSTLQPA